MAWLDGWKRRIPMYIDPTTISGGLSGSVTDFPLAIQLSESAGITNKDLLYFIQQYLPADLSSLNDSFVGGDYHLPNPNLWRENSNAYGKMCLKNNSLHFHSDDAINTSASVRSAYKLSGDFDIQILFTVNTEVASPTSNHYLTLQFSGAQYFQIRRMTKSGAGSRHMIYGTLTAWLEINEGWSTGGLRVTRIGSAIRAYYWDAVATQWEFNGSTSGVLMSETTTSDVWCYINFNQAANGEWDIDVDSFTVNSYGSIVKYINAWDYEYFAITAGDGTTRLPVEMERILYTDASSDEIVMWTKVPEVSNTEPTYVYLYYNKDMDRNPAEISFYNRNKAITVMHPDNEGTYDTTRSALSCVRKEGDVFKMWYTGYDGSAWRIMYATSADGVNWSNHQMVMSINIEAVHDTAHATAPCVIKDGEIYKMWYGGHDGSNYTILYSTSIDGINWNTPVQVVDHLNCVDDTIHAGNPCVLKENNTYKMWYSGYTANWSIIYAESSNGTTWSGFQQVVDKNEEGVYDTTQARGAWVEHDDDKYKMWYSGSDGTNWRCMYATTSTGINDWGNHQMIFDIGTEGIRDAKHAYYPCVLADPYNTTVSGSYLMWYTGIDESEYNTYRTLFTRTYGGETQFARPSQTVWDDYFMGVWHMADSPSDEIEIDSTIRENDMTTAGAMVSADRVTGQIGQGIDFDGIDDRMHIDGMLDDWFFEDDDFTVEVWVNPDTVGAMEIISKRPAGLEAWIMFKTTTSGYGFWASHSPASWDIANSVIVGDITADEFAKLTVSRSGNSWKLYKNLVESPNSFITASGAGGLQTDDSDLDFGFDKSGADHLDGILDEIRISKGIGRSYDYIKLSYYSETDDLLTFGDPEYRLIPRKYIEPVDDYGGNTVRIWGELDSESWQAYMYAYWGDNDGGDVKNNWDHSTFIALQDPEDTFDTVIDAIPFTTTYYRFFATFSGSEPTEEWTPSYSYYNAKGKILKGTSNNFTAVWSEPDSTFYNTKFAVASYGYGAALNIVKDDDVVGCYYATTSGLGNGEIREDASDLTSVR